MTVGVKWGCGVSEQGAKYVAALDGVSWESMEADVVGRLRAMRSCWEGTAGAGQLQREMMARDLFMPALDHLARFCASVEVRLEAEGE